jgi:tripartite ATP-independent transporter DctM subunit
VTRLTEHEPISQLVASEPGAVEIEHLTDSRRSAPVRYATALVEIPAVILSLVMMTHIVAQAVGRKSGLTIPDTLETVEFWYMPLVAMLGFISAHLRGENVVTDLLMEHIRPVRLQRALGALFSAACTLMCLGFAYFGWIEALRAQDISKTAGTSSLVIWPVYFVVPVVFGVLAVLHGRDAMSSARGGPSTGAGDGSLTAAAEPAPLTSPDRPAKVTRRGVWMGAATIAALVVTISLIFAGFDRLVVGLLACLLMLLLIFLRVPVAFAMAIPGLVGIYVIVGVPAAESTLTSAPLSAVSTWSLSVVPMFVLMGLVLWRSGIADTLYKAAAVLLHRLPGGLAVGTNVAGTGMASVSGSTIATTYALARTGLPQMLRAGYDKRLALGAIIVAGLPGQLIPPSIMLVIYAGIVEVPVGQQLMAGLGPGIVVSLIFTVTLVLFASRWARQATAPVVRPTGGEKLSALVATWPVVVIAAIVFGGMFSGYFTSTEVGALAALAAIATALVSNGGGVSRWKVLSSACVGTVAAVGAIFLLLVGVEIFARMASITGVGAAFADLVTSLNLGRVEFLLLMLVVYLVLGTFMEPLPMLFITMPVLLPILQDLDISLIWFGVFAVFMGELAILSPPVGVLSFVIHSIARDPEVNVGHDISLNDVYKASLWFLPSAIAVVLLLIAFPGIATWLPDFIGG